MNCKQGDMAVIVNNAHPDNVGGMVECLAFIKQAHGHANCWLVKNLSPLINHYYETVPAMSIGYIPDCDIKPIRGNQKQDTEIKELELVK